MASSQQQQQQQPQIPDEALFSRASYLRYVSNNRCINFTKIKAHHKVIIEILKRHPLSYALSATTTVPEGHIDNVTVQITQQFIKDVLRLPQDDYDEVPSDDVIIRDLVKLGYDETNKAFTYPSRFLKMNLAALWSTLFMPINRCLTPKKGSQDKCSLDVLKIFHGVAYGKRYDFSVMIWKEFVSLVRSKSTTYVPFLRFLKLIIREFMEKVPGITTRSHDGCPNDKEMRRLTKICGNTCVKALRIPEELLAYADPQSSAVVDYRSKNPMDPAATLEPTPQGRIASNVGVGSEGAGELELKNRNVSSQAGSDGNENNIPEGGGVSLIGVVEESVVKTVPKKRKDRSTTIGSSRVATSSVGPSTANTPVSVDNIERDSSSPLEHAHTPPSHLSSSQKDIISLPSSSDTHNTSTLPPDEHQKYSYMDLCTMLHKKIYDEPQKNSLRAKLYQLLTLVVSGNTTPEMEQELTQMGNGNEGNSSKSQQDLQGRGSSEVPTNTVPVEEVVEGSYEETVEVKIAEISDKKQVTSDVVRDWDPVKGLLGASSSCLKDEREVLNIKVYQRKKQKASQEDEVVKEDEQQTENSDTSSDDILAMFLRKLKPDKEVGPSKKRRRIHESVSDKEEDIQDQTREDAVPFW